MSLGSLQYRAETEKLQQQLKSEKGIQMQLQKEVMHPLGSCPCPGEPLTLTLLRGQASCGGNGSVPLCALRVWPRAWQVAVQLGSEWDGIQGPGLWSP